MSALSVRRPLSVLAVLAMIATLLFAVAGTASAATVKPSDKATFSACPDNADIPDAGFTDVPTGSFFDDAVNCLAYYTVTTGTTPTTYGPGEDVTRAQMAVFLYRMADKAGVVLDSTPPDAGFTDIAGLSTEAQTAINALAAKGIVKGKTTTTYAPADTVWRQQMALFLARFSDAATAPKTGPGGTQADDADDDDDGNNFTDLGGVTVEANTAINETFHLGVATGTTATTFDPLGNVNRGQMSLFLTRLAAHMNIRPAGVNIQANPVTGNDDLPEAADGLFTPKLAVTYRSDTFMPVSNTLIDQFSFASEDNDPPSAFNNDGSCDIGDVVQQPPGFGDDACEIDTTDEATDGFGNGSVWELPTPGGFVHEVYAWTGSTGADFDEDTTVFSLVTIEPTAVADGYTFELDGNDDDGEYEFGETATWVIQVQDGTKDISQADWEFTLTTRQEDTSGNVTTSTGVKIKTDADGQIVIEKTFTDPDTSDDGDGAFFEGEITDSDGLALNSDNLTLRATWSDDDAIAESISLSTSADYEVNSDGAANSVVAKVTDQFGNGVSGIGVCFTSTAVQADDATAAEAEGVGDATYIVRSTNSSGQATLNYDWDWDGGATVLTSSAVETIEGFFAISDGVPAGEELGDNLISDPADCAVEDPGEDLDATDYYWVRVAPDLATTGLYTPVRVVDEANQALVISVAGAFHWFQWDSGDQFNIDENPPVVTASITEFEDVLFEFNDSPSVPRDIGIEPYFDSASDISSFQVR